ncbi:MAG TPA: hypothetical protein VHV78_04310 [Gemmatimonadaceae bacterium]|jgi:hypothetical protein|nr:hypothetical protein [Gemmatimonadaceae bacterium]
MRTNRTALAFSALLGMLSSAPTVAAAQRGGGGTTMIDKNRGDKNADWNSINGNAGIKLSNRDVDDINPIKLLIGKRKDLKLSDAQLTRLKEVERKLKDKNDPSFRALDSLRRAAQPPLHDPSDNEKARMMDARRSMNGVVRTIRDNYEASLAEALPLFDEGQRSAANVLVEKQRKDAEGMLQEKLASPATGG